MMLTAKDLKLHKFVHKWLKNLEPPSRHEHKGWMIPLNIRIFGRVAGVHSTEQSVNIIAWGF